MSPEIGLRPNLSPLPSPGSLSGAYWDSREPPRLQRFPIGFILIVTLKNGAPNAVNTGSPYQSRDSARERPRDYTLKLSLTLSPGVRVFCFRGFVPIAGTLSHSQLEIGSRKGSQRVKPMSDFNRFFGEDSKGRSGASSVVGGIGSWLLHLVMVAFALYSAAHGINAALQYSGSSPIAQAAQIVGIVVVEIVLFGIYLAFLNGRITGSAQTIVAGITYIIGFTLACLGIVADSQLNAGNTLSPELSFYLRWGLPIAPAIMAFGALLIHALSPESMRDRKEDSQSRELDDLSFSARLAIEKARAEEEISKRGLQVMSRKAVLRELENIYSSEEFREAIRRTAIERAPELFSEAGILIDRVTVPGETAEPSRSSPLSYARTPERVPQSNGRGPSPL